MGGSVWMVLYFCFLFALNYFAIFDNLCEEKRNINIHEE